MGPSRGLHHCRVATRVACLTIILVMAGASNDESSKLRYWKMRVNFQGKVKSKCIYVTFKKVDVCIKKKDE